MFHRAKDVRVRLESEKTKRSSYYETKLRLVGSTMRCTHEYDSPRPLNDVDGAMFLIFEG